jgi:signal transduction histidine kinase
LLFARPSAPKLATVPLGPLLETTAVLLKRDPQLAQVEVVVRAGTETVVADSELLQIVFSNLLINSAQAMNGAGRVTLTVAQRQTHCDIAVHDTGPGMPSEIRERVFEPFFTTKHRGTGLGLSTARRLVELHGGTVTAECPPGGGTVVTISLPVRTGTAAASGRAAAHAARAV